MRKTQIQIEIDRVMKQNEELSKQNELLKEENKRLNKESLAYTQRIKQMEEEQKSANALNDKQLSECERSLKVCESEKAQALETFLKSKKELENEKQKNVELNKQLEYEKQKNVELNKQVVKTQNTLVKMSEELTETKKNLSVWLNEATKYEDVIRQVKKELASTITGMNDENVCSTKSEQVMLAGRKIRECVKIIDEVKL